MNGADSDFHFIGLCVEMPSMSHLGFSIIVPFAFYLAYILRIETYADMLLTVRYMWRALTLHAFPIHFIYSEQYQILEINNPNTISYLFIHIFSLFL